MIEEQLINNYINAKNQLIKAVSEIVKEGDICYWKCGSYKGRKVIIKFASPAFELGFDNGQNTMDIEVLVKTERADGKGFLASDDFYHQRYRSFSYHFTKDKPVVEKSVTKQQDFVL